MLVYVFIENDPPSDGSKEDGGRNSTKQSVFEYFNSANGDGLNIEFSLNKNQQGELESALKGL